jgi:hypothetical protein
MKASRKAPLLVRTGASAPAIADMFVGTGDELPDVGFLQVQDVRDLAPWRTPI